MDKLVNLIHPTWANPYLLLDQLVELEELVDDCDLLGAWFSAALGLLANLKETREVN